MAEFNDKIIEMGCDFWIDTEEDAPSVVTRMTGIQPSWATTKGEIFRTIPNEIMPSSKYPENSLNKTCGNYPALPILKKTTI